MINLLEVYSLQNFSANIEITSFLLQNKYCKIAVAVCQIFSSVKINIFNSDLNTSLS